MKFTKRYKRRRKLDRSDADIIASKIMFDDAFLCTNLPLSHYDKISDRLCGKPSRKIYEVES